MADTRADELLSLQSKMEARRSLWQAHWQECADYVLPRKREFIRTEKQQGGEKRGEKIFDSTAPLALERFAAAMESILTPRTQRWHRLRALDKELAEDPEVKRYLDQVNDILFRMRYAPRANFASQAAELYLDLGAFGTGGMFIADDLGRGVRYTSVPLEQLYFALDAAGSIDLVHRDFEYTARQAVQTWGDRLPLAIRRAAERDPQQRFRFLHCVRPREEGMDTRRRLARAMPWASYYVSYEGRMILEEGGYRTFPYCVSRYTTSTKEEYGRGPTMTMLADIKTLNEQEKTILQAGQLAVFPALLLPEDGVLQAFAMRPGYLNYGGLDDQGRAMAVPLETGANLPLGLELSEQRRKAINDGFLVTLFQILVETPQMTATEAMLRAQEKGALLAPTMGRQQSEFLGPLIERELDIAAAAGLLPPMPEALASAGGGVHIEYESPMVRAQRAEEGVGILRMIEAMTPLAQIDPRALRRINADEALRVLAEVNGVLAKVLYTDEELAAMDEAQQQQAQLAGLVQAAPAVAQSVKDLAQAQSIAGAAPSQMLPAIVPQAA